MREGRNSGFAAVAAVVIGLVVVMAGCGGDGGALSGLPLRQDFTDCSGFTMNDAVATVDCPDGELRILVSRPETSPVHFVPHRFDVEPDTLVVSAQARAPEAGGAWGVGCLASGVGEAGRGYALLVTASGEAAILRIDSHGGGEGGRFAQEFEVLSGSPTGVPFVPEPARNHLLRVRCAKDVSGAVRIRASVDGGSPLTAKDDEGIGPFSAAIAIVATDRPGTDVRFDDLVADARD